MIYYKILINEIDVTSSVAQGFPLSNSIGDELDSCTLILKGDFTFEKFQNVKIEASNNSDLSNSFSQNFLIMDIRREKLVGYNQYILTCIEPTKILENINIIGLASTGKNFSSLYNQINYLVGKINRQLVDVRLSIDESLSIYTANKPSEEFKWDGLVNIREVFDDLLSSVDLAVRVKETTISNGIRNVVISFDNPNQKNKLIDVESPFAEEIGEDTEYKANAIISVAKNASNYPIIASQYSKLRGDNVLWTTDDDCFMVNYPINEAVKLIMYIRATRDYTHDPSVTLDPPMITANEHIDITKYLYEKDEYDLLSANEKKKALWYTRNNNKIEGFNVMNKHAFSFDKTVIEDIIQDIMLNDYTYNIYHDEIGDYQYTGLSTSDIIAFALEYYPLNDALIFDKKQNQIDTLKGCSVIKNQNNQSLDINRYASNIINQNKHIGNAQRSFCKTYDSIANLPKVGDYRGTYIVDKADYSFFKSYVKANIHLTNGLNNINEKTALKREKRIYNIPLDGYIDKYYFREINLGKYTITDAAITSNIMESYVHCEVLKYNVGNDRYFLIKPNSNSNLGYFKNTYSGKKINQPIMYTDGNGECEVMTIAIYRSRENCQRDYSSDNYPIMNSVDNATLIEFQVYKDAFERPIFVLIARG